MQIPEWFKGARMNYAENLLRHPDDDHIAYYYTSERIQVRLTADSLIQFHLGLWVSIQ